MPIPSEPVEFVKTHYLTRRSAWRTNLRFGLIITCYLAAFAAAQHYHAWTIQTLVWFSQALILVGLLAAIHEAAHGNLYDPPVANRLVGNLLASFVGTNFSLYRYSHFHHHKYTLQTGDPEVYPNDRVIIENLRAYWRHWILRAMFPKHYFIMSFQALKGVFPYFCEKTECKNDVLIDSVYFFLSKIIGIVALVLYPQVVFDIWILPLLIACAFWFPLLTLPEHYGCNPADKYFGNTRTTVSNSIVRLFFWNANYHAEHHLYPSVPFYNIPKLHQHTKHKIINISPSYLLWHIALIRYLYANDRPSIAPDRGTDNKPS